MTRENFRVKNKIRELRGFKCQNPSCQTDGKPQFAHIKGKPTPLSGKYGRGRKERYYDVNKHPDCYMFLCEKCHRKYDAGLLKRDCSLVEFISAVDKVSAGGL